MKTDSHEFARHFANNKLKVLVKPGQRTNSILGWDEQRKALKITIKERAEDNKANIELVNYLSKLLAKRVRIKSGFRSKEKIVEMID
ncbi:MAG: DUF167 domain-containing protein [Nanoarchaeota archaeon]